MCLNKLNLNFLLTILRKYCYHGSNDPIIFKKISQHNCLEGDAIIQLERPWFKFLLKMFVTPSDSYVFFYFIDMTLYKFIFEHIKF